KEMPELSTWKERFPQVTFLSADFEKPEKVRQITEKCNFNWTHLANDNYFTKWVGGRGYPMTLVLATDGTLQYMVNGTNEDIRKEIIKAIEKQVNTSKK
ncbi:TlpA family protein disulfide reductase, partial [Segatella oris]